MESNKSPLLQLIDKVSFFDEFSESEKCEIVKKSSMVKKYEKKDSTIFSEGDKFFGRGQGWFGNSDFSRSS